MIRILTLVTLAAVGLAISENRAAAEEAVYIDTHVHLHPQALDAVMGQGHGKARSGSGSSTTSSRRVTTSSRRDTTSSRRDTTSSRRRGPGPGAGGRMQIADRPAPRSLPRRSGVRDPRARRGSSTTAGPAKRAGGTSSSRGRVDTEAALAQAADKLVEKMDREGVARALVVMVPARWGTTEEVARHTRSAVARHPGRLTMMGGGEVLNSVLQETDPDAVSASVKRSFEAEAEAVLASGAAGFGEMISYHLCMTKGHSFQMAMPDHPLFLRLADVAARHGVPIDLHLEAVEKRAPVASWLRQSCSENPAMLDPTIPGLERLLAHNREARIVWQHIGWDNTGQMTPDLLRRLLKEHSNLYLSLRVVTLPAEAAKGPRKPLNRIVGSDGRITPEWRSLMADFPDRMMIGSDEFVSPDDDTAKLARSFDTTWSILDELPADLARQLGGKNAARVYGLD